jgi:hypothetical protein
LRKPLDSASLTAKNVVRSEASSTYRLQRPLVGYDRTLAGGRVVVMAAEVTPGGAVVLETDRLLLRRWRVAEAVVQREL